MAPAGVDFEGRPRPAQERPGSLGASMLGQCCIYIFTLALPPGGLQDAIVAPSGLDCARLHQESAVGAQPLIFCCGRQVSCAGVLFLYVSFPDWFPFSLRCFLDLMDNRANVGTMWNMFFTLPSPIAAPSMPGRPSPQYLARRNARSDLITPKKLKIGPEPPKHL